MKPELTERQAEVLAYIKKSILKNGYAPNTREIGKALGIASPNGVQTHLRQIEAKGYLKRVRPGPDGRALSRAMVVVD